MPSNQRQIIEQTKFTYSPLRKSLEKQRKTIKDQGRKKIDAIANWKERLAALTNKDNCKESHKVAFAVKKKVGLVMINTGQVIDV